MVVKKVTSSTSASIADINDAIVILPLLNVGKTKS